jgi:nucleoid-associated protein YgaU
MPGSHNKGRGTLLFGIAGFLLAGLVSARGLQAQEVAEAARQERERKAAEAKSSHHVYTEEDLKRAQILTPEDQARVAARKNNPTEKKEEQAKAGGESAAGEESLAEVARRYRKEKAEREAARAIEQGVHSQFQMKLPEVTMAAPKTLVQPKAEARDAGNSRRGTARRLSPFEPRPLRVLPSEPKEPGAVAAPSVPETRALRVRPEVTDPGAAMATHKVERGDSWWKLARVYLGDGARWHELRTMNADDGRPAELLLLGSTVRVPAEVVARKAPAKKSVKVARGDTLWKLAREHLGRGTAWKCLAEANPELGAPERLRIGQRIMLPADGACLAGVVARVAN